jgi:YVTN family beta-propeller protein
MSKCQNDNQVIRIRCGCTNLRTVTVHRPISPEPPEPGGPDDPGPSIFAYVTNAADNTVSVIDTSTNAVIATIPVGFAPYSATITPDGTRAYVANANDNTISVIDTSTNTVIATIPVASPHDIDLTPDGTHAYVTNTTTNTVSVLNTATNTVITTIPVGNAPHGIAITPVAI